jgi:hypothetical protein
VDSAAEFRRELSEEPQVCGEVSWLQEAGIAIDAPLDNVKRKARQHRASASRHVLHNGAVMRLVDG